MERENPEDVAILDSVEESDIICVKGDYDHIHLVLEAFGVRSPLPMWTLRS